MLKLPALWVVGFLCVRGVVASVVLLGVWAALVLGVVFLFFSAVLLSRLVAWLCRSGLCPLRSVSSFSEKRATTQGTICRAASPELPFSGIPAIVIPDDQVASGGLFCLGHYFIVVVLAGCGYRFLSFPSSSSLEATRVLIARCTSS